MDVATNQYNVYMASDGSAKPKNSPRQSLARRGEEITSDDRYRTRKIKEKFQKSLCCLPPTQHYHHRVTTYTQEPRKEATNQLKAAASNKSPFFSNNANINISLFQQLKSETLTSFYHFFATINPRCQITTTTGSQQQKMRR